MDELLARLDTIREDLRRYNADMVDIRTAFWERGEPTASLAVDTARNLIAEAAHVLKRCRSPK